MQSVVANSMVFSDDEDEEEDEDEDDDDLFALAPTFSLFTTSKAKWEAGLKPQDGTYSHLYICIFVCNYKHINNT